MRSGVHSLMHAGTEERDTPRGDTAPEREGVPEMIMWSEGSINVTATSDAHESPCRINASRG